MKKNKGIFKILAIFIVLIILFSLFNSYRGYRKRKNIFKIGQISSFEEVNKTKAFLIFNEFPLDNFTNINLDIPKLKLYGVEDEIDSTLNFDAIERSKNLLTGFKNSSIDQVPFSSERFFSTMNSIYEADYSKIDYSYFMDLNPKEDFSNRNKVYLEDFSKDNKVFFRESGFLVKGLDGYETLVHSENLDNITGFDFFNKTREYTINESGIKYVNNKRYYMMIDIDANLYNLSDLSHIRIYYNDKNYQASLENSYFINKKIRLVYKLMDGIEDFIDKRLIDVDLKLNLYKGYNIPKSSVLHKDNNLDGVYRLKDRKIEFCPIRVIKDLENDKVFIESRLEKILPDSFSSFKFNQLNEFDDIIINPDNIKEGQFY